MNKIYKVIWSKTRNCYVAVSEIAKRNGKDRTSVTGGAAGSRQAARVLCALLLGAYLTAGYSMPVAWGTQVSTNEEGTRSRWGTYAVAEAENSTAWGVGESNKMLKASGIGSTAFGHSTNAIGDYSTAWGCGGVGFALRAVGDYSTAFGFATTAYSNGSTAWGNGAIAGNGTDKTKGEYATAWGGDTRAEGKYATSFGYATTASGEGATAWGGGDYDRRTVASGNYSTAFGTWTNAKSENSTAWGYRTIAGVDNTTGKYATAFGNQTTANTEGSTAWGNNTTAGDGTTSGTYATAWGYFAQATGAYSTAFGSYTKATGRGATAWGRGVNASETDAVVASGSESTAFGTATHAYGNGSTAWGFRTVAGVQGDGTGGEYSTAWGQYSQALGHYSTAFGGTTGDYKTIANAVNSLAALGGVTEEDAYDSAAIGKGAKTVKADTVALGGGSVANIASGVAGAYKPSDVASDKAHVWTSTRNAIAVGDAANSITRQITGVAAGSADTDAVNVAQLTAAVADAGGGTDALHVYGSGVTRTGTYASAWGYSTKAAGNYSTAFGYGTQALSYASIAWGQNTIAGINNESGGGGLATAFGAYTKATGYAATAWGQGQSNQYVIASGNFSTAFGYKTTASGDGSTAWGNRAQAIGEFSTAFGGDSYLGISSTAYAKNSLAALGGVTETAAANSAAIGVGAKASLADTVALGSGAVANRAAGVTTAKYKGSNTGNAWVSTKNAIAVGNDATDTRQITGVAAGSADTDAVNVAQLTAAVAGAGGGTAYTAGDGIAIDTSNNTISVKADSNDFEFDSSTKALKIKKNGAVASGNTGLVTGGTVFTEVRPSSDGTYVKKTSTTGANLTALDTQVKTNTDAIGNASSGLVKKVNDNTTAIGTKANAADVYTITAADAKFAAKSTTLAGYGITDAAMLNASNINVATWASKLGTGTVTSSSTNLITGKTVYTEVRPANDGTYVKTANTTAANLTALDTQVKANADALAGKADSTTVYSKSDMDTKLNAKADAGNVYTKAETDTKLNAKANTADVYTKTETDSTFAKKSDVYTKSDVDTKLNTKADKDSVYTKTETDTKLNTKADKDSVYTKTETDTKLNTKADKDSVYTKTETDTKLNAKADASNVYTKSDVDTKLDTKADKTELATVKTAADTAKSTAETAKTTADAAKAAVDTIADTEKINTLVNDVDTLKKNEGGEVVPSGESADKNVSGEKVYNYLNKDSLELGAASTKVALGQGSKIKSGTKSVAVGFDNTVDGDQNIAIGTGHTVKGSNNIVIGDPDTIDGNDNGIFGNNVTVNGSNTFVIGHNVQTSASNAVILGNESEGVEGAVSVGAKDKERQIKHVKAGQDDTDAVNVGQMNAAIDNAVGNNMINMSNQINKLDSRINKVGAGAAALAALHPLDMDGKFGLAAGFGNYRNANAMALGFFYRPTDRVMFSVGGSMGNGENMMNAGVSIALDKGVNTSKAAMARKIHAQDTEIQTLKAENAEIKEQNAKLAERLAAIEAKLGK